MHDPKPQAQSEPESPPERAGVDLSSPQQELARRLNLLLDLATVDGGRTMTYREISAGLRADGIKLSRARWAYMISGRGPLVTDAALLAALARVLEIDADYLTGATDALPERVGARLESLRSVRVRRVHEFAARSLIDVAPETLRSISLLLEADLRARVPAG